MLRKLRRATSPGWLTLHVVTVALAVTMILLGRWQLDVSDSKHFNLQNFGYALQWWAFTAFVLVMWFRVVRDGGLMRADDATPAPVTGVPATAATATEPTATGATATTAQQPTHAEPRLVEYRRYVMPTRAEAAPAEDATLGAYNDYLARLAADDDQRSEGTAR